MEHLELLVAQIQENLKAIEENQYEFVRYLGKEVQDRNQLIDELWNFIQSGSNDPSALSKLHKRVKAITGN